ncbi:High-affinity phosphodiesterase [Mycena sanguinolenta]|uniref:Phosphodiesterase n=1 Tax=Mycena sanguinolenta TaxID=230812 RepID=A0A8H6XZT2_9AGAR|nr:High-affinity phosphodiesterase [Mycena sanguinolenta]
MCGHTSLLSPPAPSSRAGRRRSADIGGLCLATKSAAYLASLDNTSTPGATESDSAASWDSQGAGKGWLGHSEGEQIGTRFAELLSDMYTETLNAVNEHAASCPPDLPPSTRAHLISQLSGWNFEPSALPDEDHVAACAVLLFEALFRIVGMREAVGVDVAQIPPFIAHLRAIYRTQNSYHNFAHALDVLQATYSYLRAAEMVPPVEILLSRAERASVKEKKGGAGKKGKGRGPAEVGEGTGTGGAPSPQAECGQDQVDAGEQEHVDAGKQESNDEEPDEMWLPPRAFDSGPLVTVLGREELFVLAVAAIGHDVGHPGFTNLFMANAAAPLSAVFDGQSPLEQLHCALLMRVMRAHGMGALLDGTVPSSAYSSTSASSSGTGSARGENTKKENERKEEKESKTRGKRVRRLLADVVLATDMRVHGAFMERYEGLLASEAARDSKGTSTSTDGTDEKESLEYRRTTLCQGIIKCADISNPSRPYYISKHWAKLLLREWNAQAALERHHRLPATVEASGHPLREAHSQMFFIPAFVKPLLDLVVRGVPEMKPYAAQCDFNLALWKARLSILQCRRANEIEAEKDGKDTTQNDTNDKNENDTTNNDRDNDDSNNVEEEDDPRPRYVGAFPLALPPSHFGGHFSWSSTTSSAPASPPPWAGLAPAVELLDGEWPGAAAAFVVVYVQLQHGRGREEAGARAVELFI